MKKFTTFCLVVFFASVLFAQIYDETGYERWENGKGVIDTSNPHFHKKNQIDTSLDEEGRLKADMARTEPLTENKYKRQYPADTRKKIHQNG